MRLKLEVVLDLDNAAFDGAGLFAETGALLDTVRARLVHELDWLSGRRAAGFGPGDTRESGGNRLLDGNGNGVGTWSAIVSGLGPVPRAKQHDEENE